MKRNDIGILFTFLEQFRPEATGRERERPQIEVPLLERFADGNCDPHERQNVCDMLRIDFISLRWLADRVKLKRRKASPAGVMDV